MKPTRRSDPDLLDVFAESFNFLRVQLEVRHGASVAIIQVYPSATKAASTVICSRGGGSGFHDSNSSDGGHSQERENFGTLLPALALQLCC